MTNRVEVKITIARLIEVAYSKDKGMTTKIVRKKAILKYRSIKMVMPFLLGVLEF